MAYTIRNADGTVLLTLPDNQIDQVTTSVTLVGRNYSSYGQFLNTNLVNMLQNFATDGVPPRSPLVGQVWYNKSDGRLYVYTPNSSFSPVGVATVSPSEPTAPNPGDLWIDSVNNALYFSVNGIDFTLAGPTTATTTSSVKNGWYPESIVDVSANNQIIAALYNNNKLLAIASSSTFSFSSSYGGMTAVQTGINLNTSIPGIKFIGTATSSDTAGAVNTFTGVYLEVSPAGSNQTTNGQFNINNNNGLVVGTDPYVQLGIDSGEAFLEVDTTNAAFNLFVNRSGSQKNAFRVVPSGAKPSINLWPNESTSSSVVNINADVYITGSLTTVGTDTNITTDNLNIKDKNIQLAFGQVSPSDAFVDGGGITLIGTTNHSLTWSNTRNSWEPDANFNLPIGSVYKIDNQTVLTSSTLGTNITSAFGLARLGTLAYLTVTNISITSSTISTIAPSGSATLYLNPAGSGSVDVGNSLITNVSTGTNNLDAANIGAVKNAIAQYSSRGYMLSVDTTGMASPNTSIASMLEVLLPVVDPYDGTRILPDGSWARVLCTRQTITVAANATIAAPSVDFVEISGVFSTQQFVTGIPAAAALNTTATYVLSTKEVREFIVTAGAWLANGANPIATF